MLFVWQHLYAVSFIKLNFDVREMLKSITFRKNFVAGQYFLP